MENRWHVGTKEARLEENELAFLREHRSAVWNLGFGRLFVSSDRAVRTWNFIGALASEGDAGSVIDRCRGFFGQWELPPCLKLTPFSRPHGLQSALASDGWRVAVTLDHMVHPTPEAIAPGPPDVRVCAAASPEEVRTFSEVQSAGFGVPDWVGWVETVNQVNVGRPHQRFYVARIAGEPVGVTLLLLTGEVAGLYAVATLPEARGRGVARALVHRAAGEARDLGATTLCLNTAAGGPAQAVFSALGFRTVFPSRFFVPADGHPED